MPRIAPIAAACTALLFGFCLSSCSKSGGVEEITETRTLTTAKEAPKEGVSSAERFGMTASRPMTAAQPGFTWTTPEGWEELPAKQFRPVNLRPAADPKAECYVSKLDGAAGGLVENINRWRNQMGLEPIDEAAIATLPQKPLLGAEATYIDLDGTFGGMSGDTENADYKMVGLILAHDTESVFVKFTGPKALVEQELPKFEQFCASLKRGAAPGGAMAAADAGSLPEGHPPIGGADQASGATTEASAAELPSGHPPVSGGAAMPGANAPVPGDVKFTFSAPTGWVQKGGKTAFREITFAAAEGSPTECYVTELANTGGGLEANINRWAGQMGAEPLTAEGIAALPKIKVFGNDAPVAEFRGTFTGMSGDAHPDYTMLGTLSEAGGSTYFIKMVGPAAEMEAQTSNFTAFCESLKLK
ncbi:MAG: hypothetical protein IT366_15265 [Candidatus Hydrogenedentes bacterium]|nr:hypothetical protein [Candidatus Hydrogenedentota bacterium]